MGEDAGMGKRQRLAEIYRRMENALAAASHDEAFSLLSATINEVEDEFTSIPFNPPTPPDDDGRLYPPQADNAKLVPGRPDLVRYRSRGHYVLIRDNGAIGIYSLQTDEEVFSKSGADGRGI